MPKNIPLVVGITILFLGLAVAPLTQGVVKKAPNNPVFELGEDPIIVRITISPENPAPLSTITFTAEIKGENITEVYMWVKEANDIMCMPTHNISMNKTNEEIYVCTITLEFADATYFGYKPLIFCNGSWYEFEWRNQTLNREGTIFYVGGTGPNNYTKIQDAINDASDGDTVYVYDESSPYSENVVIDRTINLIGEDKNTTVIDGMKYETVVSIQANKVYISEFTIRNSGNEYFRVGIDIGQFSNNNNITSNIITNNWKGIHLVKSNQNTILGNKISNNSYGLSSSNCHLQIIKGNTVINNGYGISLGHSFGTVITGNNITSNKDYGIYISKWGGVFILKNNFIDNEVDAYFWQNIFRNRWKQNYWNEPLKLPKIIYGKLVLVGHSMPLELTVINIDWRPAKEPYDI